MCARSAPEIDQNALVLLRNIIGIIKTHIHDNHIEFEVSGRFGGVWPRLPGFIFSLTFYFLSIFLNMTHARAFLTLIILAISTF